MVVAYDDTLIKTLREQNAQRDDELETFRQRFAPDTPV